MSRTPYHPLVASLTAEILYPEDPLQAYLPTETILRMHAEVAIRNHAEPALCLHLIYAFIGCHNRGLFVLAKQLLQMAKVGMPQDAIERVIITRRAEPENKPANTLPPPPMIRSGVSIAKTNFSTGASKAS